MFAPNEPEHTPVASCARLMVTAYDSQNVASDAIQSPLEPMKSAECAPGVDATASSVMFALQVAR